MTRFTLRMNLHGTSRKPRPVSFDLGDIEDLSIQDEVATAMTRAGALITALVNVTTARAMSVKDISLSVLNPGDIGSPIVGTGTGDNFEKALVNVWSINENDEFDVLSLAQVYIPAPVVGVFQATSGPGYDIVDVTDANLIDFIDALAANAFVSDGETIQVTEGSDGMHNGRRVSTPVSK